MPWAAIVVMTSVVGVQAIVFQDGGLLALGPNLFNMALVGVAVSHFASSSVQRILRGAQPALFVGAAVSAWLSIVIAALACALELAVSGTSPANLAIPAMGGIHALIGVGEAVITVGAVAFLRAARPDLLQSTAPAGIGGAAIWIVGALVTLTLVVAAPLASTHPDGLNWVAQHQGFWESAQGPLYQLIPNYKFPGIADPAAATIAAAGIGSLLVLITTLIVVHAQRTRRRG